MRAPPLSLELSISQITGAARPALGCKVSPRLAQRGCELVVTLVREVCVFLFLPRLAQRGCELVVTLVREVCVCFCF